MDKKTKATIAIAGILVFGGVAADNAVNPYTDKGTTLEITTDSHLTEAGQNKVVADKTEPKITLQKWDGEVSLGIKYTGIASNTTGDRPFMSKNVEWVEGSLKMEAVTLATTTIMEDGGMEINIILNSQPATNIFNFQLSNWENLNFSYQAPLWQEVGLKQATEKCTDTDCDTRLGRSHRPENVVGSYAVYYKDHVNHIKGQTNYATGKAYHIYRPLVTDNNGNTVWADLSYSNGVLTVTVPQVFLDSAVYPVVVDPTFGYTTHGGTTAPPGIQNNWIDSMVGTPADTASVDSVTFYGGGNSGTVSVKPVIVLASNLNFVSNGVGPATSVTTTIQEWVLPYSVKPSVTASTDYYSGFMPNGDCLDYYDFVGSNGGEMYDLANNYTSPTNPTGGTVDTAYKISIWGTYTVASTNTATGNPNVRLQGNMSTNGNMNI